MAFFGMFPPVVTGQATANALICDHFEASGWHVERITLSPKGARPSGKGGAVAKIVQYIKAYWRLLSAPLPDCLYLSLEANNGKYLSIPIMAAAAVRGRRCVVHHHAYSYIGRPPDLALKVIHALSGSQIHIFQCKTMADEFRSRLPSNRNPICLTLSNAFLVPANPIDRIDTGAQVELGFMGAITEEKGIFRALEVATLLKSRGVSTRLHLAGPCDDDVRSNIDTLASRNELAIQWHGIVAGEAKIRFFESIDVFLFPSTYRNETQGIVNIEALAAGRPVIAIAQCCVGSTIMPKGGLTTDNPAQFVTLAADAVKNWHTQQSWPQLSENARAQYSDQLRLSIEELSALQAAISPPNHGCGTPE